MLHKALNSKGEMPYCFPSHPSNFKVTRDKTSPILTQIGRFRTIGRSQLSNPSDLPCFIWGYVLHIEHISCHHESWPTSVSHPFPSLNSSLGFTGGKHYQKVTIPIFRLVLQNFVHPGCFSYILFYCYSFSYFLLVGLLLQFVALFQSGN